MAQFEHRRLNNRTVDALRFDRETLVWDRHLPGFAVRVYPSGTRTYIVQTRGPYGARRVTLGRHGKIGATEARRRAWQVIARIKAGQEPLPEHSTSRRATGPKLADMAARYMDEYVAVHCKPATLRIRSAAIYRHLVPRLGKLRIGAIRRRHVARLHQGLAATPVEANNAVITLSQIFTKAQDWGILAEGANPCRHVELYRQRKRERFLTEAEFKRLGRVLDESEENGGATPAAIAAIRLLILTGCRRGEILGLRWDDVDLESRELRLRDTKTGPRAVPLSPAAVQLLAGLPRSEGGPWVIPGRKPGTHLVRLGNAWRLLRKRAGLEDVRLHDLRHSFASSALALGESLPMIARLLGVVSHIISASISLIIWAGPRPDFSHCFDFVGLFGQVAAASACADAPGYQVRSGAVAVADPAPVSIQNGGQGSPNRCSCRSWQASGRDSTDWQVR